MYLYFSCQYKASLTNNFRHEYIKIPYTVNLKQNYFELFDLTISFCLDDADLAEKYRRIQQQVHPDRFADASDQEKRLALQYTVFVNEAYKTLAHPVKRAAYLLSLCGRELIENRSLESDFLMRQIELRESLEEIEEGTGVDQQDQLEHLNELKSDINQMKSEFNQEFTQVAKSLRPDSVENDCLDQAEELIYKMQYTEKLLQEVSRVEDRLMDY